MEKCKCCGKEGLDEKEDYCYGCGHVICHKCTFTSEGEIIGWSHTLRAHKAAHKKGHKVPTNILEVNIV